MKMREVRGIRRICTVAVISGLVFLLSFDAMAKKSNSLPKGKEKSSIALINEAYHAGEIDKETWIVLKAQAIFKPEELPLKYRGEREMIKSLTPLIGKIRKNWEDFSKKTKAKLKPLLLRPTDSSYLVSIERVIYQMAYMVPEAAPYDTSNFRVHYVTSTDDAPNLTDANSNGVPDYVETVGSVFEEVYAKEIADMAYNSPPGDGTLGGNSRYDVYLKDIGNYDVYGWADPEGLTARTRTCYSFIVIDNDYSPVQYVTRHTPTEDMQVTAAHEFFHAVQFGYDAREDGWWMEATAVWMEDEVYDTINDYLQYLNAWFHAPQIFLDKEDGRHEYGSSIYAKYLSEKEGGADRIRTIWERCRGRTQSLKAITEDLDGIDNFRRVFKNFTTANFIDRPTRFVDPQYNYEDDAAPDYPDINIEASYPIGTEPNQHFVGKDPLPTKYGDRLYMLDDKKLPHLASHYLKFTPPEQLDKPTKLYINFKKGPGGPRDWGARVVLVRNDDTKVVKEITESERGHLVFDCNFGITDGTPKDTEIKEVILTPSNLDQRSGLRKYQYSAVVIPQFEDAYTPTPNSGTSKTVYNFDPDNVYKSGDTIHLEVNLSYKARVTADFSEVDVNFNPNNVVVTESDPIEHKYEITYTIDTAAEGNGLPVKIKAQDLTGTGFNIDETFLVNQTPLVITIIYPQDGETIFERRPTIVAEITSLIGAEVDLSSIIMTLDTSVVEHNWRALSPDRSSVEIYYTPTGDLSYDQHTVTVDAKDINGLAAEQKVWIFIVEEKPWRFKVTPAYMLSGESAIVSLRSLENTPTKTIRYSPAKITQQLIQGNASSYWGPERYITLTNQGKDGDFFLYTGTITPSDYLDGYYNDGSGSGELYCNDGGTIRKCSLGIYNELTTADIVIEEVSPIFEKSDGPYVTVTGYFRQLGWAEGSNGGFWCGIYFINYDEYLHFAQLATGSYGTVYEEGYEGVPWHIICQWARVTLDVKLHEGENLIQIYNTDYAYWGLYGPHVWKYVSASTIVNVPSGVCTPQVAVRSLSRVAADVSGPDPTFKLGEVYSFPNPAKRGKCPTIHIESGIADRVEINIYDIAGDLVHSSEITDKPEIINGKYAYEYRWNVSNVPSGVYVYLIRAKKSGKKEIKVVKKLAIVK